MKKIAMILVVFLFSLFFTCMAYEWGWEDLSTMIIKPKYFDIDPCDGHLDAGSWENPYIIKDIDGLLLGEIRSRYPDSNPCDGILDVGSHDNPYILIDLSGIIRAELRPKYYRDPRRDKQDFNVEDYIIERIN